MTDFLSLKKNAEVAEKIRLNRVERYALQSVAKKAIPDERVSICLRNRLGEYVAVCKHKETKKAFYNGLMVCGSVWACPVCAAKISEKRRLELKTAFSQWQDQDGNIAMLTLTFSHKKSDKLKDTISRFSKATTKFMTGRAYHTIRQDMGIVGRVRAFEVTYGVNGFHPHLHIAIFYKNETDLASMQHRMYDLWSKACIKFGLTSSKRYGLSLQGGEAAEEYLSKHGNWSLEQEMSKAHIKVAKHDSMTPFDFLRNYLQTEDAKMLDLFKEYFTCFKGKRQLQWSQGLKKMFDLDDKSDEELAAEKIEEADVLGMIDYDFWKLVIRNELRGQLLNNVELYGFRSGLEKLAKKISPNSQIARE